jgi:hypothetical protein
LSGIAFKVAYGHHRRFCRREIPTDGIEPTALGPGPEDQLVHARARQVVLRALGRLSEKDRSVLVMHDIDGVSVREIADQAEQPRFTVHTRLRRARARFEELVRTIEAEPRRTERRWAFLAKLWWPVLACGALAVVVHGGAARLSRTSALRPAPAAIAAPPPGVAGPASPPAQVAGLSGHWSFDEAPGSKIARDLSGQGYHCRLHGVDPARAWVTGRAGGAVDLGKRGWLECPRPAAAGSDPVALSVAFWLKRANPRAVTTLLDRHLGPGTESYFHLGLRGDTLQLWSGRWSHTTIHAVEPPLDGWVHVAFTHAGRTTRIFIDGRPVVERDDTWSKGTGLGTSAPVVVGALVREPGVPWQHLDGAIDELWMYDRALGADEIAALAAAR